MNIGKLVKIGVAVALDLPVTRLLAGDLTGALLTEVAGPAAQALRTHFTLTGRELGTALGDSLVRALAAIDDELNGWRIRKTLGSRLEREYQARIRVDFLEPFAAEHGLDAAACQQLCRDVGHGCGQLIQARPQLLASGAFSEFDVALLLASGDDEPLGASLLARSDTIDGFTPLAATVRAFLLYHDLLGDAVLYFFRETLRRDQRVKATLDALQQAGLWRDLRQHSATLQALLDERLAALQRQQQAAHQALLNAAQDADTTRTNALRAEFDRLSALVAQYPERSAALQAAARDHTARLQVFEERFGDWSDYLGMRLDELQQAVLAGLVGIEQHLDRQDALLEDIRALLCSHQLGERIRPDDELRPLSADFVAHVERATSDLHRVAGYQARAALLRASVLAASGDLRRAEQSLEDALTQAGNDRERALAHYNMFQLQLQQKEFAFALEHLTAAAGLDPQYALWQPGKHRPERILGAGGMGLALLVKNRLGQQRVLKLLWAADTGASERFYQEALTLTQAAGDYVPAVHDYDYADPLNQRRPYLEMDYLDGALDGEAWLAQHGPLNLLQGLGVGLQIAQALALAHARGICHHDLKPANLLLRQTDAGLRVTIIDFGLSSQVIALQRRLAQGGASGKSLLGRQIFGSLDYAPPEQRGLGGEPGPRSDLYSLAVTLYRLLTGAPPNPVNSALLPHQRELQQLLFQCLQPDPAQRPPSAADVHARLQHLLARQEATLRSQRCRRQVGYRATAVSLALAAVLIDMMIYKRTEPSTATLLACARLGGSSASLPSRCQGPSWQVMVPILVLSWAAAARLWERAGKR